MAQNGPHSHQVDAAASDDGHIAPPSTVAFSLTSAAGPYGNAGSSAGNMETMLGAGGMGKGKNLIPDLNMEERDSADGISKDKPRSEAKVEVAAADTDADKGKSVAAADDGEPSVNIALDRERRNRMKDLFRALQDLMPHVPHKTDKVTVVEEAIQYIRTLQDKAAMLGKQALARQAAARGEASSSSSVSLRAMPQTAQGMAALCASDGALRGWGGVPVPPPAAPAAPASPMRYKTWKAANMVLTVANDSAYISVWAPRRANTLTMVMSVLDNHGIDVITVQISSDSVRTLFMIYAHVTGIGGENRRSAVEVYQRAVSEIMYRLYTITTNNNNNNNNNNN